MRWRFRNLDIGCYRLVTVAAYPSDYWPLHRITYLSGRVLHMSKAPVPESAFGVVHNPSGEPDVALWVKQNL